MRGSKLVKASVVLVLLLVLVGAAIAVQPLLNASEKVSIVEAQSHFSDFRVENGKVYIDCQVTINNPTNAEKKVNLSANIPDDVKTGLLKAAYVRVTDENGLEKTLVVPARSRKSYDISFVGEYAGTDQKHDRNLPQITIQIID